MAWSSFASQIKRVIFRNGVRSIPTGFFDGMVQLQEVIIPATVTEIGENLFADHKNVSIYYEGDADLFKQMLNATNQGDIGDNVSSVRVTVEISADGSKTETIERADGTKTIIEYNPDGTLKSHTDINANGEGRTQRADDVDGRTWIFSRDPEYGYQETSYPAGFELLKEKIVYYGDADETVNYRDLSYSDGKEVREMNNEAGDLTCQTFTYPENVKDAENNPDGEFSSVVIDYANGVQIRRRETMRSDDGKWKNRVLRYADDGVTVTREMQSNKDGMLVYELVNYQEADRDV